MAVIRLYEAERERVLGSGLLRPESRSLMFRFPEAGRSQTGDLFGAVVEEVQVQPEGEVRVRLWMWSDLGARCATPGARFEVWYFHTVGDGVVLA